MISNECYTVNEVVKLLKITRQTFNNWRKNGTISVIHIGGRIFVRKAEIERLLNEGGK